MRPDELAGAGELAGEAVGSVVDRVRETHEGIAERVFGAVGEGGAAVRQIHDGIATLAYSGARAAAGALVRAAAQAASLARDPDAPALERSVRGRLALGAVNGAFGDALARRDSPLTLTMTLRSPAGAVEPDRAALAAAFPDATGRVAVFLHGLCETEDAWALGAARSRPYGHRLAAELGYTPLYLRYNTGLHISENGRTLAGLLDRVNEQWPVEIDEIALIGHSMGGLVARSACHYGAGSAAIGKVRQVFSLGSPHHGANLERLAHAAGAALSRLPETRALAGALRTRSVGIRDLYHGYLVDEDWVDYDPDDFLVAAAREIPFLQHASHYFVAATLTRSPDAPLGRLIGDLLVSRPSAWAHRRPSERLRFDVDNYRHVGGANHFELLNHPAIGDQIVRWLGPRAALPAAS